MKMIFSAILLIAAQSAAAQVATTCGPKQAVADALSAQFGEIAFATGVSVNNSVKLFGNPRTGT